MTYTGNGFVPTAMLQQQQPDPSRMPPAPPRLQSPHGGMMRPGPNPAAQSAWESGTRMGPDGQRVVGARSPGDYSMGRPGFGNALGGATRAASAMSWGGGLGDRPVIQGVPAPDLAPARPMQQPMPAMPMQQPAPLPGFMPGQHTPSGGMSWSRPAAFAEGGEVDGPGGPKDDEIPAMLSDGEYIMPAEAVKFFGTDKLNKMIAKAREEGGEPAMQRPAEMPLRMADGGPVELQTPEQRNASLERMRLSDPMRVPSRASMEDARSFMPRPAGVSRTDFRRFLSSPEGIQSAAAVQMQRERDAVGLNRDLLNFNQNLSLQQLQAAAAAKQQAERDAVALNRDLLNFNQNLAAQQLGRQAESVTGNSAMPVSGPDGRPVGFLPLAQTAGGQQRMAGGFMPLQSDSLDDEARTLLAEMQSEQWDNMTRENFRRAFEQRTGLRIGLPAVKRPAAPLDSITTTTGEDGLTRTSRTTRVPAGAAGGAPALPPTASVNAAGRKPSPFLQKFSSK